MVWFTAIISMAIVTLGWYIGNGVVLTIAYEALGDVTGQAFSLLTLIEFVAAWWGPICDLLILLWAIINSQEIDPTSVLYR
jgi:hypothetical protein